MELKWNIKNYDEIALQRCKGPKRYRDIPCRTPLFMERVFKATLVYQKKLRQNVLVTNCWVHIDFKNHVFITIFSNKDRSNASFAFYNWFNDDKINETVNEIESYVNGIGDEKIYKNTEIRAGELF